MLNMYILYSHFPIACSFSSVINPIIFSISAHSSISYSLTRMHTHEWEIKELPTSSYTGGEYLSIIIINVIPYSSDYPLLYIPRYGNQVAFMAYISTLMGISVPCELCLTYLAVSCIPLWPIYPHLWVYLSPALHTWLFHVSQE